MKTKLLIALFSITIVLSLILPITSAVGANVAYVVKNSPDSVVSSLISQTGLSYEVIKESQIPSTNFNNYNMIVVGDDLFSNPSLIPVNSKLSLVMNTYYVEEWKLAEGTGVIASSQTLKGKIVSTSSINQGLASPIELYDTPQIPGYYLPFPFQRAKDFKNLVATDNTDSKPLIASLEPGNKFYDNSTVTKRLVYFGVTGTQYWTPETKRLFKNSIEWLIATEDADQDGYNLKSDCNDLNASIHPGAVEIPYDGVDQNCDGEDLRDVDNDGYDAEIVGGNDCNDNNASINPGASDPLKQCINFAPVFSGPINEMKWEENSNGTRLDLSDYFTDANGDDLVYTIKQISGTPNIDVDLDNSIATFSSAQNWSGTGWVIFNASDGKASTLSNQINLTVNPLDRQVPQVILISPVNDTLFNDTREIQLEFRTVDNAENLSCELSISGNNGFAYRANKTIQSDTEENFSATLPDGNFIWNVKCLDSRNTGTSENRVFGINAPDNPSFFSIGNKVIGENKLLEFIVNALDPDGGVINYSAQNLPDGATFDSTSKKFSWKPTFEQAGDYNVTFVAEDDSGLKGTKDVNIKVTNAQEPPKFSDADTCEAQNLSELLEITIKDPDKSDDFEIGDEIPITIQLRNKDTKDFDVDVAISLYDLDDDEEIESEEDSIGVDKGDREDLDLVIKIPTDIEVDNDFVIFVKAEDSRENVCNQNFIEIEIDRAEYSLEIGGLEILSSEVSPGETLEGDVKVENTGSESQNVHLEIFNEKLKLNESTEKIEIEEFDEDDKRDLHFSVNIPEDAEEGDYEITIKVVSDENTVSEARTITVANFVESESSEDSGKFDNNLEVIQNAVQKLSPSNIRNLRPLRQNSYNEANPMIPFISIIIILIIGIVIVTYAIIRVRRREFLSSRRRYMMMKKAQHEKAALESGAMKIEEAQVEMNERKEMEEKDNVSEDKKDTKSSKKKTAKKKISKR